MIYFFIFISVSKVLYNKSILTLLIRKPTNTVIEFLLCDRSPCVSLNSCLLEINLEEGLTSVEM